MDFDKKLVLAKEIWDESPGEIQKKAISKLFEKTDDNVDSDILLRLIVIDSCYSTNMNKRLFGFDDLVKVIKKINSELNSSIDVIKFIDRRLGLLTTAVGIDKKGNSNKHAFSLITKYIYFKTNYNFPIYDSLVYNELVKDYGLKPKSQKVSLNYFEKLIDLKKEGISFDDLDKCFWICGKIRKGNISSLINNVETYKTEFLDKLKPFLEIEDAKNKNGKKIDFSANVSKILCSNKALFEHSQLKKIQNLAQVLNHKEDLV
jgi:hypothetical protein